MLSETYKSVSNSLYPSAASSPSLLIESPPMSQASTSSIFSPSEEKSSFSSYLGIGFLFIIIAIVIYYIYLANNNNYTISSIIESIKHFISTGTQTIIKQDGEEEPNHIPVPVPVPGKQAETSTPSAELIQQQQQQYQQEQQQQQNMLDETLNKASVEVQQQPNSYEADDSYSSIQLSKSASKSGWCYIGEDRGFRSCIQVGQNDTCMSGDIFPNQEICVNPNLRT